MSSYMITVAPVLQPSELRLTHHAVFATIFARRGNEHVLLKLLNALLRRTLNNPLVRVKVTQRDPRVKAQVAVLDLIVTDQEGTSQLMQLHVTQHHYSMVGLLYHYEEMVEDWLRVRKPDLGRLSPTLLGVSGETIFSNHEHLYSRLLLEDPMGGRLVGAPLEMHCFEVGKFDLGQPTLCTTSYDKWLHLLRYAHCYVGDQALPAVLAAEPGIAKVIAELRTYVARYTKAYQDSATHPERAAAEALAAGSAAPAPDARSGEGSSEAPQPGA
jgi:PD-(D/E)XK nuclease family transposase